MIYKIKDEYLEVINYCNEYDEYIFKRFSQFEIVTNKEINNYLQTLLQMLIFLVQILQ